jgi:hypothetical protein
MNLGKICRISTAQVYAELGAVSQDPAGRLKNHPITTRHAHISHNACAPNTLDTADVRVSDIPRKRGGGGNDLGAIPGTADVTFDCEISLRTSRLDEPEVVGVLKDPLRAEQLVSATLQKQDDHRITCWLVPLWLLNPITTRYRK